MSNILIRGGTVVDGTLSGAYRADVRIVGTTVAEIGADLAELPGGVVDARGCYVTPGIIEPHTHFDAAMW